MAVGEGSLISGLSYVAVGRETAFGTYTTCTAQLNFLSSSIKTTKEARILEQIARSRTYAKQLSLSKSIEGDLEFYFVPIDNAYNFILQNAFGGTVTSATGTGESTSGLGFDHTFEIGAMDQSYPSLCLNMRKGPATTGQVFEYSGVRVNEITFTGEIDEPLMVTSSLMCKDSTQTSNDVENALTVSASNCLSFVNGRISVESTFASLTSSSFWHVQSVEFGINNSLKSDSGSRRIGSDVLDVLPPGIASFTLNMTIRFDTSTAFDAMIAESALAAELQFQGDTMASSSLREGVRFRLPKIRISDAGDPEIGGPDEILTRDITFNVLRDDSSASGYAVQAVVTNNTSSYA